MLRTITLRAGRDAEQQFTFAFQHQSATLLDALDPRGTDPGAALRTEQVAGPPSARAIPTEENICGHGPGSPPAMW